MAEKNQWLMLFFMVMAVNDGGMGMGLGGKFGGGEPSETPNNPLSPSNPIPASNPVPGENAPPKEPSPPAENEEEQKKGQCFAKPKKLVKNRLERCRCEIFKNMQDVLPESMRKLLPAIPGNLFSGTEPKAGEKRKPCTLGPFGALLKATPAYSILVYLIQTCFWTKMNVITVDSNGKASFDYGILKQTLEMFSSTPETQEDLIKGIDSCITEKFKDVKVPAFDPEIQKLVPFNNEDVQKLHCIGELFVNKCSDSKASDSNLALGNAGAGPPT